MATGASEVSRKPSMISRFLWWRFDLSLSLTNSFRATKFASTWSGRCLILNSDWAKADSISSAFCNACWIDEVTM